MEDAPVARVRHASRQMVRELGFMDARLGCFGLSHSECHALIELEAAGSATPQALAERLNVDKSNASRVVKALANRGLVLSGADKSDGRRRLVRLSAAGRKKLAAIHEHANGQVDEALGALDPEAQALVVRGLELYARALERGRRRRAHHLRPIAPADDPEVAALIRAVMPELGADGPGFALHDPEVSAMSEAYRGDRAAYFVLEREGRVVGGAGFGPLAGGTADTCELRKMYFLPEARGLGLGRALLERVLDAAKEAGYRRCYLETTERMQAARALYEKLGFARLCGPVGATGHFGCDAWYARDL